MVLCVQRCKERERRGKGDGESTHLKDASYELSCPTIEEGVADDKGQGALHTQKHSTGPVRTGKEKATECV